VSALDGIWRARCDAKVTRGGGEAVTRGLTIVWQDAAQWGHLDVLAAMECNVSASLLLRVSASFPSRRIVSGSGRQ